MGAGDRETNTTGFVVQPNIFCGQLGRFESFQAAHRGRSVGGILHDER